ncbi:unnamed protein product [Malus baccata var. baccata]
MSGYSHPPPGYGYGYGYGYSYGNASPPGQPYGAPPQGQLQHQQHQTAQTYGAPSTPYGSSYKPEKPHNPAKPLKNQAGRGGYPAPAPSYGSLFAALVPSVFPSSTDPEIIACFQLMQRALSSYNQSFSLRTVHLLMYLFTQTNTRKIVCHHGDGDTTIMVKAFYASFGLTEKFKEKDKAYTVSN